MSATQARTRIDPHLVNGRKEARLSDLRGQTLGVHTGTHQSSRTMRKSAVFGMETPAPAATTTEWAHHQKLGNVIQHRIALPAWELHNNKPP